MIGTLAAASSAARRIAAMAALTALIASGCGDSSSTDESSAETTGESSSSTASSLAEEAQPGGSITYLTNNEPATLLPDIGFGVQLAPGGAELFAIYDALAVLTPDSEIEYRLAESMESEDGVVWTITLRPDLVFSDGTPFDAEAIQYNWTRMADPAQASPTAPIAQTIASMSVVDATTLEVTLKEPNAQFALFVAQTALAFIASPTAWEAAGEGFATAPVGAGPFVVAGWDKGTQLRLERNESYWDPAYLDAVTVRYIPDETQRLNTFTTGDADVNVTGNPRSGEAAETAGSTLIKAVQNGGSNIFFNLAAPPFDDIDARQAIVYAFDAIAWNDALFGGAAELAPTVFLEDSPFYSDVPLPTSNREEAQRLFDELAAAGRPLEFTVKTTPTTQATVEWFQTQLESFNNVSMEIEPVAAAQIITEWRNGNFSMGFNNAPRFTDPVPALHNALRTGGSQNFSKYSNPAVDEAFAAAAGTTDEAERRDAYVVVQEALAEDLPVHFFSHLSVYVMYDDALRDLDTINDGVVRWDKLWHG